MSTALELRNGNDDFDVTMDSTRSRANCGTVIELKVPAASDKTCGERVWSRLRAAWSLCLSVASIGLLALASLAEAQRSSPKDFTDEERAQFEEAPQRYQRWTLPPLKPSTDSPVSWIDGRRLLWSVRELPTGWKAAKDELSKIVVVDSDTGVITETRYRGDLVCYSPQRMIIQVYPRPYAPMTLLPGTTLAQTRVFAAGVFGEELKPLDWPRSHTLIWPGCQVAPLAPSRDSEYVELRMLPEHGVLRVMIVSRGSVVLRNDFNVYLVSPEGKTTSSFRIQSDDSPTSAGFFYLPWLDSYFAQQTSHQFNAVRLIRPSGQVLARHPHKLLAELAAPRLGTGWPWVVKPGTLWQVSISPYKNQGLYLDEEGKLYRLDGAHVSRVFPPSPDGCRILYRRHDGDPEDHQAWPLVFENTVIDFCKGK